MYLHVILVAFCFLVESSFNGIAFLSGWDLLVLLDVLTFIDCCCLTPYEQFFSDIMARTSYIRWEDDDVCFAVDQHAKLDFYSAISMKQRYNWNTVESAVNQHIPNPNTLKQ